MFRYLPLYPYTMEVNGIIFVHFKHWKIIQIALQHRGFHWHYFLLKNEWKLDQPFEQRQGGGTYLPLFLALKQLIRLQVNCTESSGYHISKSAFTFVTKDLGSYGRINIHKA